MKNKTFSTGGNKMKNSTHETVINTTIPDSMKQYNQSCLVLLQDAQIQAHIVKAIVKELDDFSLSEVESIIQGRMPWEKDPAPLAKSMKTLDPQIRFRNGYIIYDIYYQIKYVKGASKTGIYINVEAMNNPYPGYPLTSRGVMYSSASIVEQYNVEYDANHYEEIKKIYVIWLILQAPDYMDGCINIYQMKEDHLAGDYKDKEENYDKQEIVSINIGKNHKLENKYEVYDELLTPLFVLFTAKIKDSEEKLRILKDYGFVLTDTLKEEVKNMCDLATGVLEQGREQGGKNKEVEIIVNAYSNGFTLEQISSILCKPVSFIQDVIDQTSLI